MIGLDEQQVRLSRTQWAMLLGLAAIVAGLGIVFIASPGYMDADYYFLTSKWLAEGFGFQERVLWNYLDDPQGIPHPSHLYWLPLTSIIAAIPMSVLGSSFNIAQIPFAVLMVLLVLITTKASLRLNRSRWMAVLSGMLAIFSGFYFPFFLTTDTFTPFAVIGSLCLLLLSRDNNKTVQWLLVGVLIGLGHLTRVDGALLLLIAIVATYRPNISWLYRLIAVLVGYLVVMFPWWFRNLQVVGSIMTPGSERVFWLLSYDEIFTYPAEILRYERWISSGLMEILGDRIQALWTNFQSLVAVNGLIFLLPLIAVGFWHFRKTKLIQLSTMYLILLLLTMSFVFPYVGARGAYFHSSAALMPIFWAVAPRGLELVLRWISVRRGWNLPQATRVFAVTAIFFAAFLSLWIFLSRVLSPFEPSKRWGASGRVYQEIGARLGQKVGQADIVLANNPPGFTLNTGVDSIVIPNGGLAMLVDVAERYQATWVVLEQNHPEGLNSLYQSPESVHWLELSETLVDSAGSPVYIYQLVLSE